MVSPSLTCLVDLLSLFSTLSKAHLGYLHLVRAFLRCSFSCWSNSGLLHSQGRQAVVQEGSPLPSDSSSSQAGSKATTNPPAREPLPKQATTSLQVRQALKLQLGQAGIGPGTQSGTEPPGFPGEHCCLPGRQCWLLGRQPHTYPPNRLPQGSSPEDPNPKWVINLSSKPLTPAQRSVLAKGPNFVVSPKQPPNLRVHNCHRGSLH